MAIDLTPLLHGDGPVEPPIGPYVPPTSTGHQETADVLAEYLDANNPDLQPTSLAKLSYEQGKHLEMLLTDVPTNVEEMWERLNWLIPLLPPVVGATVVTAANTIRTLFNRAPVGEEPTIFDKVGEAAEVAKSGGWSPMAAFDVTDPWWLLVDSVAFLDATHFEAIAHAYVITLDTPVNARSTEVIDGETVYFGAGWVSELAGTARSQRSYLDFLVNLYHREGHLMNGVMVNLPKGGTGTIDAYRYTPT